MAKSNVLPKLDLGGRKMPQLRVGNAGNTGSKAGPVRDVVSKHGNTVLSNRDATPTREKLLETRERMQKAQRLHIALVLPDIKIFGSLKNGVYVLKPQEWKGDILVHILLQRKGKTKQEVVFGFALTQLGLITPSVAKLQYPEELELGWSDSNAPINEDNDGTT